MSPRFIAYSLVGLVGLLAVTTLVRGRPTPPAPQPVAAVQAPPVDPAVAARRRIIIEPLPVPMVSVRLANVNTQERATFQIGREGEVTAEQASAIERFFRCRRSGRHMSMSPGVLALLADVAKRWPGRTIEVISGFRAPPFGAPHSKHFRGHAIDLRIKGVRTSALRDFVWRGHQHVGVGHYPGDNFVHMDWRPGEPDTAWTAANEEGTPNYHPRWARRARQVRTARKARKDGPGLRQPTLATAPIASGAI